MLSFAIGSQTGPARSSSRLRVQTCRLVAILLAASTGYPLLSTPVMAAGPCDLTTSNPVVCENSKPGTSPLVWQITGAGDLTIQGFATDISVNKGGTVHFKIDTPASDYVIDIYRLGSYAGLGARKQASNVPVTAPLPQAQPACLTDTATGLIDCGNWSESASWNVPADAVSGIYFALLTRPDTGGQSHIFFVVRDDASTASLVFKTSDTTWEAYNRYGGNSLYFCTICPAGSDRAYKVSYNRPFVTANNGPNDWVFSAEAAMVSWLEGNGYDVSYISSLDIDRLGAPMLEQHRAFLSVGHDEYWSGAERTSVETARDAGVNLAFFSANEVFWKTRWEPSIDGSATANRTLVCYKETRAEAPRDPLDPPIWTGTWRDPRSSPPADGGRPENALSGNMFMVDPPATNPIMVPAADGKMRFWRNTSVATLAAGTSATLANNTLGYEWDEVLDNGFSPPGLIQMSSSTYSVTNLALDYGEVEGPGTATHHLTLYRAPSGALVFGAGTIQWSWGLSGSPDTLTPPDLRMEQATVNLLADMSVQPLNLQAGLVAATKSTDTTPPTSAITTPAGGDSIQAGTQVTITGTAIDAGGGVVGGVEVTTDGGATWHPAVGRESWSYTWLAGGSGPVTIRSRAVDDSGNIEAPSASVTVSISCPCSIWSNYALPVTPSANDSGAVEVGVKFRSDADLSVSAIRFYKGSSNTGTHVGHLWTSSGQLLASVTFTSETASGWQQANFAAPVSLSEGVTYVASYFAPAGHYAYTSSYFYPQPAPPGANGFGNGQAPLHALLTGTDGPNGVFLYSGSSGFPTASLNATNYWVDILAAPTPGPDTLPPVVTSVAPADASTVVAASTSASATFNEAVNSASISFVLNDPLGHAVQGTLSYNSFNNTATFQPGGPLAPGITYTASVQASDIAGNAMAAAVTWSFTVAGSAATCPCSIWSASAVPATVDSGDGSALELGVKFRTDVSGFITGIRFYKSAANSGPHLGNLWSATGTLLASATFTNETASGWQQVTFDGAVPVTAGTTYVASYFTRTGHYAFTRNGFATSVDNPPLHGLADGSDGANGLYAYGSASAFPTSSFGSANYWVDVVFNTTGTPDTTPPSVTAQTPTAGATGVAAGTSVSASFNEAVRAASIVFQLRDPGSNLVAGSSSYDPIGDTVSFTPGAALTAGATYSASVQASDIAGNAMTAPVTWSFTVAGGVVCPCSIWSASAVPATADAADTGSVEVGVKFRSDVNGFVTGIRFYKGVTNTGTHIGNLWSSTGTLLASATFSGETASGWQQVTFSQPVPVTANTTYVASYLAPAGGYAVDQGYFSAATNNPPLHALADGVDGPNGVYHYGTTSVFPTSSYNKSNYWVDVVFTP